MRLNIGNSEDGQAYRLRKILDQTLVDYRRSTFPLGLFEWFSLRNRPCATLGADCRSEEPVSQVESTPPPSPGRACPMAGPECWTETTTTNRNGRTVDQYVHRKWSGLIGYGTQADVGSHVPRKVFYVLKDFIASHTRLDFLVDDFMSKRLYHNGYDHSFWNAGCTSLATCDSLFVNRSDPPESLRMHAPARSHGPWQRVALTSQHHIDIRSRSRVVLDYDFSYPSGRDVSCTSADRS